MHKQLFALCPYCMEEKGQTMPQKMAPTTDPEHAMCSTCGGLVKLSEHKGLTVITPADVGSLPPAVLLRVAAVMMKLIPDDESEGFNE